MTMATAMTTTTATTYQIDISFLLVFSLIDDKLRIKTDINLLIGYLKKFLKSDWLNR